MESKQESKDIWLSKACTIFLACLIAGGGLLEQAVFPGNTQGPAAYSHVYQLKQSLTGLLQPGFHPKAVYSQPFVESSAQPVHNEKISAGQTADMMKLGADPTDQNTIISELVPQAAEGKASQPLFGDNNPIDFTFGVMPDTQFYSKFHPDIFRKTCQWFADQHEALNLKYVFHLGDIVHNQESIAQWDHADKALKILDDARIPYGLLAGNHDVGLSSVDYRIYERFFGEKRYRFNPWYGGSYKNNRGHFDLIDAGGKKYIMLAMGWGISEKEVAWMNHILHTYQDRTAILYVHDYLFRNSKRTAQGQMLYDKVVRPNRNVRMVINGHTYGAAHRIDRMDDDRDGRADREVVQILVDYQDDHSGQGYIRVMGFDTTHKKVYIRTFSPYTGKTHLFDNKKDNFEVDLDTTT
ncbi:metallophosphoesterase [Sporolactobacillus sp. THM7-7]|nr:metallophosphoesterase [Sporolactobacillus sp. THM7-7]